MTAAELRALAEALSWHVGQTFTPGHKETFAQAAELIELLAWAEESQVGVERWGVCWWAKINGRIVSGDTLIGTLRRAREASK